MWQKLSEAEWRDHELNKFRGWLLAVITVNCVGLMLVPVSLWFVIADLDPEFSRATREGLLSAGILGLFVGAIGGVLSLYAIWTRHFRAQEIYFVTSLIAWVVEMGDEVIWSNSDLSFQEFMIIYAVIAALFLVAPSMYLFIGARPNVMFKHRVRASR